MKGTTLQDLERLLRLETDRPLEMMAGDSESAKFRLHLSIAQETLFEQHNWRGFKLMHDIPVEAGQEYVAVPDRMHLAKTIAVYASTDLGFVELDRGFDTMDMRVATGQTRCWDLVTDEEPGLTDDPSDDPGVYFQPRIRLFPVPEQDMILRIEGHRKLRRLTQADDRAELDDKMIVLAAAARILGREDDLRYKVVRAEARRAYEDQITLDNSYGRKSIAMAKAPRMLGAATTRLPRPRA